MWMILVGYTLLALSFLVDVEWTRRGCGHRERGTIYGWLNPFGKCAQCKQGSAWDEDND